MKLSFIIPSVDRNQELQECIASIENAYNGRKDISIEILVIVQTQPTTHHIQVKYPENITFYNINRRGLSIARNYGIKECSGDYLIFLDDDAAIATTFIDVLLKAIDTRKADAFCGRILDPVSKVPFTRLFVNTHAMMLRRPDYRYFMGSAHVLNRKLLERIGCYDERFGAGAKFPGAEESDVFFRLKACEESVLYFPELVVFHRIPEITPPHKVYDYSYAIGAMLAKHCLLDKPHFLIYLWILVDVAVRACIRIIQHASFSLLGRTGTRRQHYQLVLNGLLKGFVEFATREEAVHTRETTHRI